MPCDSWQSQMPLSPSDQSNVTVYVQLVHVSLVCVCIFAQLFISRVYVCVCVPTHAWHESLGVRVSQGGGGEKGREWEIVCGWDPFWQTSPFFRNNHLFPLQRERCVTPGCWDDKALKNTLPSASFPGSVSSPPVSCSWCMRPLSLRLLTRGCGCHWRRRG